MIWYLLLFLRYSQKIKNSFSESPWRRNNANACTKLLLLFNTVLNFLPAGTTLPRYNHSVFFSTLVVQIYALEFFSWNFNIRFYVEVYCQERRFYARKHQQVPNIVKHVGLHKCQIIASSILIVFSIYQLIFIDYLLGW